MNSKTSTLTRIGNATFISGLIIYGQHQYTHTPSFIYNRFASSIVSVESRGSKLNPYDIYGERIGIRKGTGTGFIVNQKNTDGKNNHPFIVTNYHVIEDAEAIFIDYEESAPSLKAHISKVDIQNDIAILDIDDNIDTSQIFNKPRFNLCKSPYEPKIGEYVVALGNPYGLDKSITLGIVSGVSRSIGGGLPDNMIQIDAPINPGNSGGPLISLDRSCVLGVNTGAINTASGIGFAVPAKVVSKIL